MNATAKFSASLIATAMILVGCASKPGPLFPPPAKPIVWPGGSEATRVCWVGQLSTSADLKPSVGFGEKMGQAIFGKKPTYAMLSPYAACSDGVNRLFVADSNGQFVHVFDMKTRKYERWTPKTGEKRFAQPVGITFDTVNNHLIVADSVAARLFIFDTKGNQVGEYGAGVLTRPAGLAFDERTRRIYVADPGAHRVMIFGADGKAQAYFGSRGTALGQFNFPTNVAVDSWGRIYVSDSLNFRVQQFDSSFRPTLQIGRKGDSPGYFSQPKGIAVDSDDHLYVVDANFENVQIFDNRGRLLMDFGVEGGGPGEFWIPAGIYIDATNRIWVADVYNRRVQVFQYVAEGGAS